MKKDEAASANLKVARDFLALYRALVEGGEAQRIQEIETQIRDALGAVSRDDAAKRIRRIWDQVVESFSAEPGETHPTRSTAGEAVAEQPPAEDAEPGSADG